MEVGEFCIRHVYVRIYAISSHVLRASGTVNVETPSRTATELGVQSDGRRGLHGGGDHRHRHLWIGRVVPGDWQSRCVPERLRLEERLKEKMKYVVITYLFYFIQSYHLY